MAIDSPCHYSLVNMLRLIDTYTPWLVVSIWHSKVKNTSFSKSSIMEIQKESAERKWLTI